MKLGALQLERLFALANPSMYLIVGDDRLSQSLVRRGLLRPKSRKHPRAMLHITPSGLRALADAYERGDLKRLMKWRRRKRAL